ncbi:MAG: bifunctional heptose 7-phosphate kinase/heptose 1-phosphate adenyltransferase [Schwartzia sp. (in: firmicutes)]
MKELTSWAEGMAGKRLLVIGDMIADIYLEGRIARVSREAPVLVLEYEKERVVAGGAANVVNNAATLGGAPIAVGLVGDDAGGAGLKAILRENGAAVEGLFTERGRPTTAKTRIVAGGRETVSQQIVRVDRESRAPLAPETEAALETAVEAALPHIDGLILSDYGGGVFSDGVRRRVIEACQRAAVTTMVDSRYAIRAFTGVDYVKQNDAELAAAVGRSLSTEAEIRLAGRELLDRLGAKGVLVTRGAKGMTLFEAEGAVTDIPVPDKSEVYDVSGAGDTSVAAFMLALAAGAAPVDAARIANVAAGIAVRKLGTATVSAAELCAALEKQEGMTDAN